MRHTNFKGKREPRRRFIRAFVSQIKTNFFSRTLDNQQSWSRRRRRGPMNEPRRRRRGWAPRTIIFRRPDWLVKSSGVRNCRAFTLDLSGPQAAPTTRRLADQ